MQQFVLATTGPTGAGKSTISEKIAKHYDRCVNIDTDHVKQMIVSGFYEDASMPAGGDFTEWELVGESIGLLTTNFLSKGFSVAINGAIHKSAWIKVEALVSIDYKIMLLPDLSENIRRDKGRRKQDAMGEPAVAAHQNMFLTAEFYADWQKIDTTLQTIEETFQTVLGFIK